MLRCGLNWQPTAVDRVIETYPTSTRVAKVKTDQGVAFLKGMGNPAGNQSLAMEVAGAELAVMMGLFVPDFAILELAEIQVPMVDHGFMQFGPAFVSKAVQCITSDGSDLLVSKLNDPSEIAKLVLLDTWIRNLDRCPPGDYFDPEPRRDNLCFTPGVKKMRLMVIDHSHCFVEGDIEDEIANPHFVTDDRIYGRFPEFSPYLNDAALNRASEALAAIDETAIAEIVRAIPVRWGPTQRTRDVWIDQLVARKAFVADRVVGEMILQANLGI